MLFLIILASFAKPKWSWSNSHGNVQPIVIFKSKKLVCIVVYVEDLTNATQTKTL